MILCIVWIHMEIPLAGIPNETLQQLFAMAHHYEPHTLILRVLTKFALILLQDVVQMPDAVKMDPSDVGCHESP